MRKLFPATRKCGGLQDPSDDHKALGNVMLMGCGILSRSGFGGMKSILGLAGILSQSKTKLRRSVAETVVAIAEIHSRDGVYAGLGATLESNCARTFDTRWVPTGFLVSLIWMVSSILNAT